MKIIVITTITSTVDVDTMQPTHAVHFEDPDALSEVSREAFGILISDALKFVYAQVVKNFPSAHLDAIERVAQPITDEEEDEDGAPLPQAHLDVIAEARVAERELYILKMERENNIGN